MLPSGVQLETWAKASSPNVSAAPRNTHLAWLGQKGSNDENKTDGRAFNLDDAIGIPNDGS
jgi:hypothetical protein